MPALTRWSIRAALINLLAALGLGAGLDTGLLPEAFRPVFFHLFMLGGVAQFIFGVAWWMFPPLSRERPRGNEAAGWAGFVLLNAGMLLRALAEPAVALSPAPWARVVLLLSAAALVAAGWIFATLLWPRVKPRPGKEA